MECKEPARPPRKYKYQIYVCSSQGVQTEVINAAMKTKKKESVALFDKPNVCYAVTKYDLGFRDQ